MMPRRPGRHGVGVSPPPLVGVVAVVVVVVVVVVGLGWRWVAVEDGAAEHLILLPSERRQSSLQLVRLLVLLLLRRLLWLLLIVWFPLGRVVALVAVLRGVRVVGLVGDVRRLCWLRLERAAPPWRRCGCSRLVATEEGAHSVSAEHRLAIQRDARHFCRGMALLLLVVAVLLPLVVVVGYLLRGPARVVLWVLRLVVLVMWAVRRHLVQGWNVQVEPRH